jgi:hypothetical protein
MSLDVYFIPLGANRFEPYFEQPDEDAREAPRATGVFARLSARFSQLVREAEEHRHERQHEPPGSVLGRLQRSLMRWIAERVVEQRLLWHVRRVDEATLHVPDDMPPAEAERVFREGLAKDGDRHLRRMLLHSVGLALAIPLVVVPGPNLFGYFFTFTVVGHFLSFRGARRGASVVRWTVAPNAALTDLRRALLVDPPERHRLIHAVAERLRLPRLALFVERMAVPTA